jgi:hypothetical protein
VPYLLLFAAGIIVGRNWPKLKAAMKPIIADASEKFDKLYSQNAKEVAQRFEDFEDGLAEKNYRTTKNHINRSSNSRGK